MYRKKPLAERLEKHSIRIPFCGCHIWIGCVNHLGYGQIRVLGKTTSVHRLAYELKYGPVQERDGYHGTVIRHKCDVPCCINPDHLEEGSQRDNLKDAATRNRMSHGEMRHSAKLTEKDIFNILSAKNTESQTATAKRYGVYQSVISRIHGGKAWRHVARGELKFPS